MSAPNSAVFCARGHLFADLEPFTDGDITPIPNRCPCGRPQVGVTSHYGSGDPNECRWGQGGLEPLPYLGIKRFRRWNWITQKVRGRKIRVRKWVIYRFPRYDVAALKREAAARSRRNLVYFPTGA